MALEDHYNKEYGNSITRSKPDFSKCCKTVWPDGAWHSHQCRRKNGHGPDGAFCKQHSPDVEAARRAKARERHEKETIEWLFKHHGKKFALALKAIADGDNDPRTTAKTALGDMYEKL